MTPQHVSLGFTPRTWQAATYAEIEEAGASRIVLVVHRQAGKSEFAVMFLIDAALRCSHGAGLYAYIAPFLKQAKNTIWDRLKSYARKIPGAHILEAETSVRLPNGAKVMVAGADDPDALRGMTLDGAVLDELAQMKRDTWEVVVSPQLMARSGWALFIGTVKGITLLSELFRKAIEDETRDTRGHKLWYARKWIWNQTLVFSDAEIAIMRRSMTEAQFRQEMECDETASTFEALIPMSLILDRSGKSLRKEAFDFEARILGVDVAYSHTGDRSVIFRRQGLMTWAPWAQRGVDNMQLAAEIARQYDEWDADAIMIDAGRGEGVISRLEQLGYRPLPVNFGGRPNKPEHFVNMKAEIMFKLKAWLESGGVIVDSHELQMDLAVLQMDRGERNDKVGVIVDETMPSPDLACALACTFAYPARPKARTEIERYEAQRAQQAAEQPYDFFSRAEAL